jgi:transposase
MRYGTRTHCRRRWSRQGTRPTCRVRLGYEWGYLYVALCPFTGDLFSMLLTHLDKACFAVFVQQLQEHLSEKGIERALLIGDGATAHTSQQWQGHGQIEWVKLPTACPELNPVERFFEELRKSTSNRVWESKAQVEQLLEKLVEEYRQQPQQLKQLTQYAYIKGEQTK